MLIIISTVLDELQNWILQPYFSVHELYDFNQFLLNNSNRLKILKLILGIFLKNYLHT